MTGVEARLPADGAVFAEPWEAQAFAMTVALHERGLFAWSEWTAALSAEIAAAGGPDVEASYYRHWLAALERIAIAKGAVSREGLVERKDAWDRAARATPHGAPITLDNDPDRVAGAAKQA